MKVLVIDMKRNSTYSRSLMPREKVEIYLYFFFGFGARWDCVDNTTSRPLYPWETYLVPILQETGWAQGQVCKFAESLFPTGI